MQAAAARAALDDPQPSREQMDSTVLCSSRGRADPEEHDPRTVQEADLHRGGVDDPGPGQLPRLPGRPRAQTLIPATQEVVRVRMSRFLTAYAVIAERSRDPTRLLDSKLFWILGLNRHYAFKAVHAILCCLNKELGLENTAPGPASTGKGLIARALCRLVGNFGCYNPADASSLFSNCCSRNLICVEEAGDFGAHIERQTPSASAGRGQQGDGTHARDHDHQPGHHDRPDRQ